MPIHVSTLVGGFFVVDRVKRSCLDYFYGYDTWIDLIIHYMVEFDITLGID